MVSFTLRALEQARKRDFEELSAELREVAGNDPGGTKSVSIIKDFLREEGFHITEYGESVKGAFTAEWGEGSPVIGFIGEFNAHPQNNTPKDWRGSGRDIHASASMEAAVLTAEDLKRNDSEGTVTLFFCPSSSDETEKTLMADEGLFDTADIALSWQPYVESGIIEYIPAGACVSYTFESESAREEFIRKIEERKKETGEKIITTFPSPLVAECSITASNVPAVKGLLLSITSMAEESSGESVETDLLKACSNLIANSTLNSLMISNAESLFPIAYTEEELRYASSHRQDADDGPAIDASLRKDGITLDEAKDFGSVSRVLPSSCIAVSCYTRGVVMDTEKTAHESGATTALKGMHTASLVMAATAIDCVRNPAILDKVKEDFKWEIRMEKESSLQHLS